MAARGYPGSYAKGTIIRNLDAISSAKASTILFITSRQRLPTFLCLCIVKFI